MVVVQNLTARLNGSLALLLLVVQYGGVPFGSPPTRRAGASITGLSGREVSGGDGVQVDHMLWPLGIARTFADNSVAFPDWSATFWAFRFLVLVMAGIVVTVIALANTRRRRSE